MKRFLSLVLIAVMLMSTVAYADVTAVPVLIKMQPFEVEYKDNTFTITFNENSSTGYTWEYIINDEALVKFLSDEVISAETDLVGAPGKHAFTFEVLTNGVSTISFMNKRAWEADAIETVEVLIYKTDDVLIVEEDSMVYIQDSFGMDTTSYEPSKVYVNGAEITMDVNIQVVDGVTMVPLAETLKSLGYTIKWHPETKKVDIMKGAQWTSITVGENAYFKNRMAASPLSSAPVIIEGRTLVPAEFYTKILDLGIQVEMGQFKIMDSMMATYEGYIQNISYDETGGMQIALVYDQASEMADVILHASKAFTYFNTELAEGAYVHVIASAATTMSIPPQTSAVIFY